MRSFGGSWERWLDELTIPRMRLIIESEEAVPPLHVTGYLMSVFLGATKPPTGNIESLPADGGGFVAMFGESGTMRGTD